MASICFQKPTSRKISTHLLQGIWGHPKNPGSNFHNLDVLDLRSLSTLFEFQVTNMENGGNHPEDLGLLLLGHSNHVHGMPGFSVVASVVDAVDFIASALVQEAIGCII